MISGKPTPNLTAIHLCCGAGGTTLGFEAAGISTAFAFDLSPIVVETHTTNFPHATCRIRDINQVHPTELPQADIWTCGIPCAPYSTMGNRLQAADPRDISAALRTMLRAAYDTNCLPNYLFFENVPPYMKSPAADLLHQLLHDIGMLYHDAIFAHANYGVPQTRRRWHLIACHRSPVPNPEPTHSHHPNMFAHKPWVTFQHIRQSEHTNIAQLTPKALRGILRRQRRKVTRAIELGTTPYNVLQIITDNDLLPTVTASWYKSLSRNQTTAVACQQNGYWYYRAPTELEIRRAQSFPDDFRFMGTKRQRCEQIVRAVPPTFAKAAARAILAHATKTQS